MEVERPASKMPLSPGSNIPCRLLFCTGQGDSSIPECPVLLPGQESWLIWASSHLPSWLWLQSHRCLLLPCSRVWARSTSRLLRSCHYPG